MIGFPIPPQALRQRRVIGVSNAAAQIAIQLNASQVSGPAPLPVFFDATGTTSSVAGVSDPFRQLTYTFDYGDAGSGTWSTSPSSASKNQDVGGPMGAHVYDTPGTYVASVTVVRGGVSVVQTKTITVLDPNVVYAGSNTVCVETGSVTGTGGPAGCTYVSATPTTFSNGKRYLFKDDCRHARINIGQELHDIQCGRYGNGTNRPIIADDAGSLANCGVYVARGRPSTSNWAHHITIMDLDIRIGLQQTGPIDHFMVLRCKFNAHTDSSEDNFIWWSEGMDWYQFGDTGRVVPVADFYVPRNIFIVDNVVEGTTNNPRSGAARCTSYTFSSAYTAYMGNDVSRPIEHNCRVEGMNFGIWRHNALRGFSGNGGRHSLRIQGGGISHEYDGGYVGRSVNSPRDVTISSHVIVQDNLFGDPADNNFNPLALHPETTQEVATEAAYNFLIEDNVFMKGTTPNGSFGDMSISGRNFTDINNTRGNGGTIVITRSTGGYASALSGPPSWYGPYYQTRT